jgi:hypothetical protein
MKNPLWVTVVLLSLTGLSIANPAPDAATAPAPTTVAMAIRTELETHGERVLGKETYRWSTRLESIEDCRAHFSVRVTSNLDEAIVHVESVTFSLGALDQYGIEMQQNHWLQLPCVSGQSCVISTSTCTRKSKDGIVIDCSTPSQKQASSFSLQLDGNAESAERLQRVLRQAVDACRQPTRVTF